MGGNVLATITDRKIAVPSASNSSLTDHYEAAVASVQDYYPFGMLMGGRNLTSPVCKDSTEDFTTLITTSDLNSNTSSSGGNVTQGIVTWKPYSTGNGNIALFNQAIKVDATSTSGGVVAQVPTSALSPNTVYLVEFDITSMTSGITSFFCQLQSQSNAGQPYRVLTQKTGMGHYALLCTMPATYDFLRLRVSAVQAGTGQYFVIDNLVVHSLPLSTEALLYNTDFSNAVMSGVNVVDGSQTWVPTNGTATTLSVDNTGSNPKIKVSPSTTTDSQVQTDFSLAGGKDYIARYTLAQSDSTKRIYLDLYSRTSGAWSLTDSRSVIYLGYNGSDLLNFTLPAGADGVRFLFRRSTDAPTIPYTIDNFSISRLDTVGRVTVSACSVGDTTTRYRYGFNGKENDNEVKGQGNELDYGMRIYDPRAGKFLSVDPLAREYSWNSPYAYAENDVIRSVDIDGLEKLSVVINKDKFGRTRSMAIGGIRDKETKEAVDMNLKFAHGKDVTTRDVLIITRQDGKGDVLSYDDLNASYRKKIASAPVDADIHEDNNVIIPEGASTAIARDEFYNGQTLNGTGSYDGAKYELFSFEQKFKLSAPKELIYSTPIDFQSISAARKYLSDDEAITANTNLVKSILNTKMSEFNKANPGINNSTTEITLTGGSAAQKFLNAYKKILESGNVKVNIKLDKNFKPVNSAETPEQDYNVKIKISGVN